MKITSHLPLFLIALAFFYSVTHLSIINQITQSTFMDVLNLFYSLFFWMILFGISKNYHFFDKIGTYFSFIFSKKLGCFEIGIYLSTLFSGYPTNAKIILESTQDIKKISQLLQFCFHPSLGYVIYNLGLQKFQNIDIGYCLLFIQVLSTYSISFFYKDTHSLNTNNKSKPLQLVVLLKKQFVDSFCVFIYIFGFMLVFRILIDFLNISNPILIGLMEFSLGCENIHLYSQKTAFILTSFFLSFGGLCVLFQIYSLTNQEISFTSLLFGRFRQGLISMFFAYLFSFFLF